MRHAVLRPDPGFATTEQMQEIIAAAEQFSQQLRHVVTGLITFERSRQLREQEFVAEIEKIEVQTRETFGLIAEIFKKGDSTAAQEVKGLETAMVHRLAQLQL
jgi:hypothetical protein